MALVRQGLTICRRLPDVDCGSSDGLASLDIRDSAVHESNLRILWRIKADSRAIRPYRMVFPPERTQDSRSRQAA